MGERQTGHGSPNRPWATISGWKAVTFSGEIVADSQAKAIDPLLEGLAGGAVEPVDLLVGQSASTT